MRKRAESPSSASLKQRVRRGTIGSVAGVRRVRFEVRVEGIVQGVGFRPFVYALAKRLNLGGRIANDSAGVVIEIEGAPDDVLRFLSALEQDPPPLASIERVTRREVPVVGAATLTIVQSEATPERSARPP